ncbi:amidase [Comamonas aquatica]|jgi:amidase|uniref:Mandelamide hydrolase n=1 Tax=Comamonas aquatica TaxID=225991 RepID=A0AA35DA53_9BURK|nr:amidase [Comamonas aquatica]CAB5697957.1 Mandelamide hydrolase [Comamonas aquatica]CAB5710952.1 Mandelamide hydrolase [Comamonas aquatica]CAC9202579.1 Mandelamide hydrolase [Comamonas aquatica]CAC9688375.1 Mandelamide hydrolase [Comamonas aquatica]
MPLNDPAHAFVPYPDVPVPHASTGPLSGLYFGVKDLFDVAGYPTGGGNPLVLALSGTKTHTAPTVQKLLDAGAAFAGKTVTDELAFSMNGNNAHFGAPLNGAAPERITGGSSSGSASAVSSRLCDFALGTDTGGSVRAPASHCGLYGIRPTHGRVSLQSALALCHSYDTCGWFARDATTFARVGDVLLGADPAPLPARPRLLTPSDVWGLIAADVRPAWDSARAQVQAVYGEAAPTSVALDSFEAMYWSFRYLQGREAWMTDGAFIERYAPVLGPGVKERFAWSRDVTDAQVEQAQAFRTRFTTHLRQLLGQDGVLVMPSMPDIAPLRSTDEAALEHYRNQAVQMLCIAGLSGFPQISLPLAGRQGAPLGISLLGPKGSDRSLVGMAERLAFM